MLADGHLMLNMGSLIVNGDHTCLLYGSKQVDKRSEWNLELPTVGPRLMWRLWFVAAGVPEKARPLLGNSLRELGSYHHWCNQIPVNESIVSVSKMNNCEY